MTPWLKINEKLIRDGFRKIVLKTFVLPDGRQQDFEIKKEGGIVCVLPITKEGKVVLAKQYRPGPEEIYLELPGGGIDNGELPETAVARELLEETGYRGRIQFVTTIPIGGYSTGYRHTFVATDCEKVSEQNLDHGEFIEIIEMELLEFRAHLKRGKLSDVHVGYLGLDFLKLL